MRRITEKLQLNSQSTSYSDNEIKLLDYITIVWGMKKFSEEKAKDNDFNQNRFYWPVIDAIVEWIRKYNVKSVSKIYWCGSDDLHVYDSLRDSIRRRLSKEDGDKFEHKYGSYKNLDIYANGKRVEITKNVYIIYNENGILSYSVAGDNCRVVEI